MPPFLRRKSTLLPEVAGTKPSILPLPEKRGFQKGLAPFVKLFKLPKSNQEVFGVLFVKLSSHKKVSAGAGRVGPQSFSHNVRGRA